MIHLFYLHSEITFLVSKCIIDYENIQKEDVVFLIQRNFEPPNDKFQSYENLFEEKNTIKPHKNIFKALKKLHSFNNFIAEITNGQYFQSYDPCTLTRCIQLIINHRKCKEFSIFEHGTTSYINKDDICKIYGSSKTLMLNKLGYLGKII